MSKSAILGSSIVKKYWMALTGLFLSLFLVVHLTGNLQLLKSDNGLAFNVYAHFMTSFPLIKITSYLLYASILFHAIDGILLTIQNRKARPVGYAYNKPSANSGWASRNMALLGSIILVFIVIHMAQFWGKMHFGEMQYMMEEANPYLSDGTVAVGASINDAGTVVLNGQDLGDGLKDLYKVVRFTYTDGAMGILWTLLYVLSMVVLAFHLQHGFASSFQSLGLNHPKYTPAIQLSGKVFSVVIPLAFAIIPIIMHLKG